MNEMEILMSTGMCERDARRKLKDGIVMIHELTEFMEFFDYYTQFLENKDKRDLRKFLDAKNCGSYKDDDLTWYDGKYYFIEYVL